MRSNNREYLPAVDHLRFGAAALVVLFHTVLNMVLYRTPHLSPAWIFSKDPLVTFVAEGRSGVALFMVLSGFILTTGSLGRTIRYGTFLRNRLLRVGPLYVLVLMLALAVAGGRFSLWGAVQTTLGFGAFPGGLTGGAFAAVLWTVGVEVQFYLLFPFFLRLLNTRGPRPLIQFIGLMAVLRVVTALSAASAFSYDQLTYFSLVGRIDQFLIGMLAAYVFPRVRRRLGRPWLAAIAMAVVVAALWVLNQLHGSVEPHLWRTVWSDVEGLAWAAVLVTYVSTARFGRGRLSTALAWAGERSYGVYLLHVPVLYIVMLHGWGLDLPGGIVVDTVATGLLVVLPGALLLAAFCYASVERPALSLRKRYVGPGDVSGPVDLPAPRGQAEEPGPAAEVSDRRVWAVEQPPGWGSTGNGRPADLPGQPAAERSSA